MLKLCVGRSVSRDVALRIAMPLVAAFLAALAAHIAIDVAGDFVLPHDTFDDPAHGSRLFAATAFGISAAGAFWLLARAVLAETRGSRGSLRAALLAAVPTSPATFAVVVAMAALPLVLGMAWLDTHSAGIDVDGIADLFGGSIPLGAGITIACALLVAAGLHRLLAVLARFHHSIIRAVEAFVRAARGAMEPAQRGVLSEQEDRPRVPIALTRCTGADRAPPAILVQLLPV